MEKGRHTIGEPERRRGWEEKIRILKRGEKRRNVLRWYEGEGKMMERRVKVKTECLIIWEKTKMSRGVG